MQLLAHCHRACIFGIVTTVGLAPNDLLKQNIEQMIVNLLNTRFSNFVLFFTMVRLIPYAQVMLVMSSIVTMCESLSDDKKIYELVCTLFENCTKKWNPAQQLIDDSAKQKNELVFCYVNCLQFRLLPILKLILQGACFPLPPCIARSLQSRIRLHHL